jgi:hypothetical protein
MKLIITESQLKSIVEGFDDYKQSAPRSKSIGKIHKGLNGVTTGKAADGKLTRNDKLLLKNKAEIDAAQAQAKAEHEAKLNKQTNYKKAQSFIKGINIPNDDTGKKNVIREYFKILFAEDNKKKYPEGYNKDLYLDYVLRAIGELKKNGYDVYDAIEPFTREFGFLRLKHEKYFN